MPMFATLSSGGPIHAAEGAEEYVGIVQSADAIGRAEAVTSSASPTSSSFYNPALLRRNELVEMRLLGVEASADSRSIKDALTANSGPNQNGAQSIEAAYQRLNNNTEATAATINVTALDVAVPWFSLQTFGSSRFSTTRVSDPSEDYYDMSAKLRTGGIFGVGIGFNRFSIGVSQYSFSESDFHSTPRISVSEAISADIENGTYSNTSAAFSEFTTLKYGYATGRNVGALIHLRDGNPTAIGYSILNLGGTKMNSSGPSSLRQFRDQEDQLRESAEAYGIEVTEPADLPEMRNIGVTIGYGGNSKSIFKIAGSVDYQDIGGSTLKKKTAASFELGLDIPEDVATKYAARFSTKTISGWDIPMQVGLLRAKIIAGTRPGSYSSYGWETVFHGGVAHLSFLLLSFQGYVQEMQDQVLPMRRYGIKATLGLTLLY